MTTKFKQLKSYKRMDEKEKLEYLANVEKWTEETYPRLAALDDSWKEADMKDYFSGLELVSALQKAQGFLASHMRYDAKKRLEVLNRLLIEVRTKAGMKRISHQVKHTALVPGPAKVNEEGVEVPRKPFEMPEVSDRRPEHISQYIHLLPENLRNEAKDIAGLYDQLAHWRSRAEYLALDPRADRYMVSRAAKNTVKYESMILNFWQRVDLEYAKAKKGKEDAELMAELAREAEMLAKPEVKSAGEYTKAEIDAMEDEEMAENCKKARIEANKKYLRRDDTQMNDERKVQMQLRASELLEWGLQLSMKAIALFE
ncbi:MAG: hypothetical protein J6B82_06335 [Bacteroidaceae bacterium]|nr:hypothetical protein [Bacteroidaceae bacterium]